MYHMPGQSDNYVTAFRSWLQKHGGGGPWGPMDASWLQVGSCSPQVCSGALEMHPAHPRENLTLPELALICLDSPDRLSAITYV